MPSPVRSGCIVIGHAILLSSFQRRFGFARAIAADCRLTNRVQCPRSRRPRSTRRSGSRVGSCCRVKTSAGRGRWPSAGRRHRSRGSVECEWSVVSIRRRSVAAGGVCSCRSRWGDRRKAVLVGNDELRLLRVRPTSVRTPFYPYIIKVHVVCDICELLSGSEQHGETHVNGRCEYWSHGRHTWFVTRGTAASLTAPY